MSSERYAAASHEAIWPDTTLMTPAPARKADRHGSGPSYRRSSSARPRANHSITISPTAVANDVNAPNASSMERKNATVSPASLVKEAPWWSLAIDPPRTTTTVVRPAAPVMRARVLRCWVESTACGMWVSWVIAVLHPRGVVSVRP
jgi:hypothetical protein